jgi:hypothetical protein
VRADLPLGCGWQVRWLGKRLAHARQSTGHRVSLGSGKPTRLTLQAALASALIARGPHCGRAPGVTMDRALARRWPLGHSIRGQPDMPPTLGGQGGDLGRGEPALGAVGFDILPGHRSSFPKGISKLPRGFLWNRHGQKAV